MQITARRHANDYMGGRTYPQREIPIVTSSYANNRHAKCRYLNVQLQIAKTRNAYSYMINCKLAQREVPTIKCYAAKNRNAKSM